MAYNPEQIYISTSELADLMNWRTARVRRWLEREGALMRIGSRWYTTQAILFAKFPEMLDAWLRKRNGQS